MNILYVQPSNAIGGAELSLYNLLCGLAGEGFSFQVALHPPTVSPYIRLLNDRVEKVHVLYLPTWQRKSVEDSKNRILSALSKARRGWYLRPTFQLARIIVQNQIDLVHTNSGLCPVGAFAAFLTRRPHIWHVRERLGDDSLLPLALGDHLAVQLFSRLSKAVVCNSNYTAAFFRRFGLQPKVIYNGVHLADFEHSEERGIEMRHKLGLRVDAPVVGMVGSIRSKIKEHELFLQAMALVRERVPETQFVVFGGISNPATSVHAQSLCDAAAQLRIADQLTWADFESDIPAMMQSLDVMVHPTSQEGSGRVVMEAMAAGKPVIGVRSGGVQELIRDGETGILVIPKDPVALSNATVDLLNDVKRRQQLGNKAKSYAWEYFSHNRTLISMRDLYQVILES